MDQVRSLKPNDRSQLQAAAQYFDDEKEPWSSLREIRPEFASDDVYYKVRHVREFCLNARFSSSLRKGESTYAFCSDHIADRQVQLAGAREVRGDH